MFKRIFGSKLTVLFLSVALIGFFIGYSYATLSSDQSRTETINNASNTYKNIVPQDDNYDKNQEEKDSDTEDNTIKEFEEADD